MMEINTFISILMFVLSLCIKLTSISAAEVRCVERERQALLKFKHGIVDDYGNLSSWGSEEVKRECCKWKGISCSNTTGHVVSFNLSTFVLKAKLSPALLELQHLNYLDLSFKDFGGSEIPRFIGSFKKLRYLNLSDSNFSGEVPCELGNLTNLHTLGLGGYNNLEIRNLEWLSHFSLLSYLDLSEVNLINQTSWLHHIITRIPSLKELYLSHCQLPGPMPSFDIFPNSSLTSIDLSYNQLEGPIPDAFGQLIFLEKLSLGSNKFHGRIPKSLGNLIHLYSLDMSENELNGSLPDISKLSSLRDLNLLSNKLNGYHPQSLGLPSSLEILDLSGNLFKRLSEGIEKLSKLESLYMSSNLLEDTITEWNLSNLANLKYLDLSFNSLAFNLSSDWIPHFQLDVLFLNYCYLGPHFPNWIQTQNTLTDLYLSSAGISDALPNRLGNMSSLHSIDLSNNSISGSILQLCTIPNDIEKLYLSNNQLAGGLPNCLTNMSKLVALDLANNKFSGKIPITFGTLDQLRLLKLRDNNFIGELPPTLRNCTQLSILDVGRNKLTGKIPLTLGTLDQLRVLRLRDNNFIGELPSTLSNCTQLSILDVGRNKLTGRIPRCVNNLTALVQQDSSKKHAILDYADSDDGVFVQWKGREIEYISVLCILKLIDLSSNKLVGTIPKEFSVLKGLKSLNLSRNYLTGNIISNIGQLKTLECLDLSRNQLSGEIPNSLTDLNFLGVLDLSYNNLTGKIPSGTQLRVFNSSVYVGNSQLCGEPLVKCSGDISNDSLTDYRNKNISEDDDEFITRDFYICMTFGFITRFWAVVTTLILKHSWRHSYFNWWNNIGNWMYVTTTIYVTKFKRKFLA